jgi:thiol-disulfide isomerase/thioredoxin
MSAQVHIPLFAGATEWLNSEPLGPALLQGHVVLVNFWTLTCINWLRQEPFVRAWSQAYRNDGPVVIGVHTPEFSFEHDIDRVRRRPPGERSTIRSRSTTTTRSGTRFTNNAWPALYFIDIDGRIRDRHFGEGRYEKSERLIQKLLGVDRELVSSKASAWRRRPTGTTSARRHVAPLGERDNSLASTDRATTFRLPSGPCRFDPGHPLTHFCGPVNM